MIPCKKSQYHKYHYRTMYSLIETAKLNGLNPQAYLTDVLARIADHPAKRLAELLLWNWQPANSIRAAA